MKLEGLKVIDLSWFLPGPYLTLALADHGDGSATLQGTPAFSDVGTGRVSMIIEGYSGIAGAAKSGAVKAKRTMELCYNIKSFLNRAHWIIESLGARNRAEI